MDFRLSASAITTSLSNRRHSRAKTAPAAPIFLLIVVQCFNLKPLLSEDYEDRTEIPITKAPNTFYTWCEDPNWVVHPLSFVFVKRDSAISYVWSERNLNDDQGRAIIRILATNDYALILGMPGTGKTSTMVYAVKALLMRGASILLTSYTNSDVDNLLLKLKAQGIYFVRIGRSGAVHNEVHDHCISAKDASSVDEIRRRLDQVKVIAVTCLGIDCGDTS